MGQDALWEEPGGDPDLAAHTFTVTELAAALGDALRVLFPAEIWVEGEIRSLTKGRTRDGGESRHVYFDLVPPDDHAAGADLWSGSSAGSPPKLPVVLFDSQRRSVNHTLKRHGQVKMTDGVRVRIRGQLDHYAPQSRIQFRMTGIDPMFTIGVLVSERDRVIQVLRDAGLLHQNGALAVPPVPRRIGLVTSRGSAAEADFLHELERSNLPWEVVAVDTPTQGPEAPSRIADALTTLGRAGVHLVALVRGGGARSDLAAFDHEHVARTIAMLPVPVFTGIGHEIDVSAADAVASLASKTPTACAAEIVALVASWAARADAVRERLPVSAAHVLQHARRHHQALGGRLSTAAGTTLAAHTESIDRATDHLLAASRRTLERAGHRLDDHGATVRALDPRRTLERGFAIVRRVEDGSVVATPDAVADGDGLLIATAGGTVDAVVRGSGDGAAPPTLSSDG